MTDTNVAFAAADHWEERWSSGGTYVEFDPQGPSFCDLHKLFEKHLPQRPGARFLEVGCYPGRYLWYFHKYYGYRVDGMEYVKSCASRCRDLMEQRDVPAKILHADFFKFTVDDPEKRWDIVASFGLIEHFSDTRDVVERHLDLIRPGGYLVLQIPNHAGLNGTIMKMVDFETYKVHNLMDYQRMADAVMATGKAEILEGGYYGHIGFWNTCLYPVVKKKGRFPYVIVRSPLYVIEAMGRYIFPNTPFFAPDAALVARKIAS